MTWNTHVGGQHLPVSGPCFPSYYPLLHTARLILVGEILWRISEKFWSTFVIYVYKPGSNNYLAIRCYLIMMLTFNNQNHFWSVDQEDLQDQDNTWDCQNKTKQTLVGGLVYLGLCAVTLWYEEEIFVVSILVVSSLICKRKQLDSLPSESYAQLPQTLQKGKLCITRLSQTRRWASKQSVRMWPRGSDEELPQPVLWILPLWASGESRG